MTADSSIARDVIAAGRALPRSSSHIEKLERSLEQVTKVRYLLAEARTIIGNPQSLTQYTAVDLDIYEDETYTLTVSKRTRRALVSAPEKLLSLMETLDAVIAAYAPVVEDAARTHEALQKTADTKI